MSTPPDDTTPTPDQVRAALALEIDNLRRLVRLLETIDRALEAARTPETGTPPAPPSRLHD